MANSWWEIKLSCHPDLEETAYWRLDQLGCSGTATEKKPHSHSFLVRAYLPQGRAQLPDLSTLALWFEQSALLMALPKPNCQWQLIDEEDWSSSWKQHWQPTDIGDRLCIYPAWLTPPSETERLTLCLDPGVAFGTGAHATTQLCLECLEIQVSPDQDVVLADIGCGSGILAIAAILLGAPKVYGVDVDELAVTAAQSNRDLNQISPDHLLIKEGSVKELEKVLPGPVDGIVCNILAEVIIDLIPQFTPLVKPQGWAILSGIMVSQTPMITEALEQAGWTIITRWKRQDWCCFQVRKEAPRND